MQITLIIFGHMGYIAIILGPTIGTLAKCCIYLFNNSHRVSRNFGEGANEGASIQANFGMMKRDFSFVKILDYWAGNIDRWSILLISGPKSLAIYSMSSWLGRVVDVSLSQPIKQILIPAYATMKNQADKVSEYSRTEYRWTTVLTSLWAGFLWVEPHPAGILFGSAWLGANIPLRIIAVCGVFAPFINIAGSNMLAFGKPKQVRIYTFLRLLTIGAGAFPLISTFGVLGLAILDLVAEIIVVVPYILFFSKDIMNWFSVLKEGSVPLTSSALSVTLVWMIVPSSCGLIIRAAIFSLFFAVGVLSLRYKAFKEDVKALSRTLVCEKTKVL
jgi:O-antigen/teichoic acid export membrane protein